MSAVVVEIAQTGKLTRLSETPMAIPGKLRKGDVHRGLHAAEALPAKRSRLAGRARGAALHAEICAARGARATKPILHAFIKETWHATRLESTFFPRAFVPPGATTRCYAMEFIEAPSLKSLLRSRRLARR